MHTLTVTVTKDGDVFLNGTFDVSDEDFPVVESLLSENRYEPRTRCINVERLHACA